MPVEVRWYNDKKTVIHHEIVGKLTVDDMYQMTDNQNEMMDTVIHPVQMMLDWRRCEGIPANALTHARNLLMQKYHVRMNGMVHVGMRLELRIYWTAFERAIRFILKTPKIVFADTPEQGYDLLEKMSIDDKKAS